MWRFTNQCIILTTGYHQKHATRNTQSPVACRIGLAHSQPHLDQDPFSQHLVLPAVPTDTTELNSVETKPRDLRSCSTPISLCTAKTARGQTAVTHLDNANLKPHEQSAPGRSILPKRPRIKAFLPSHGHGRPSGTATRMPASLGGLNRRQVDRWRMDTLESRLVRSVVNPDAVEYGPYLTLNRGYVL